METPSLDSSSAETVASAFRVAVDTLPGPLFAVLDGGQFDDLEDELADAGIQSRSLFLRGGDEAMRRDGPWLVALQDKVIREHVAGLALEKPCAVFWSCRGGEQVLWRHLRSINRVRIADRRRGSDMDTLEWVIFRHADPNVLAQSLPAFDAVQFARFLGPATVLFLPEPDYADGPGWQKAGWSEELPKPLNEPLTLDRATLDRIEQRRARAIRRGITRDLRETASRDLGPVSNDEIDAAVERSEATARELGIKTAENRKKWAWLDLASDGNFGRSANMREHLSRPGADHDWDMDTLVSLAKKEVGRDGR